MGPNDRTGRAQLMLPEDTSPADAESLSARIASLEQALAEQRRAEEAIRDHVAFHSVLSTVRGVRPEESEEDLWQCFLSAVVAHYGLRMAWYGRYAEDRVHPVVAAGHHDRYLDGLVLEIREPRAPDARCAMSRAILDRKPFGYPDLAHDEGFRQWRDYALELGYRSNLAFPVVVQGRVEGGILLYAGHEHAFPEDRVERLGYLVAEMGRILADRRRRRETTETIRRERRLLRQVLALQERERRMFAYEIHDGLAQQLAGALWQFRSLHDRGEAAAAEPAFRLGLEQLESALAEARRLIAGLRPRLLDEQGVVAAVAQLVEQTASQGGPRVEFQHRLTRSRLEPTLETAVFRILQEGLSNAVRHGRSDRIRLRLDERDGRLEIEIRDWGLGFDPQAPATDRFGLQGIRERARLLGGTSRIESSPGSGTTVRVALPVSPRDEVADDAEAGPA